MAQTKIELKDASRISTVNYWIDLFTGTTWNEFVEAGSSVTGFRSSQKKLVSKIAPGDILLCYLTGASRWVGALEVVGLSKNTSRIWSFDEFPERLDVRPLIRLSAEYGVPMDSLEGKVSFFEGPAHRGKYKGVVRASPRLLRQNDGETIQRMLNEAANNRVARPVDSRKLARIPFYKVEQKKGRSIVQTAVSVPESEEPSALSSLAQVSDSVNSIHTEIQYRLLKLGSQMGFDIWVARNDRNKIWNGEVLGSILGNVRELPTQFNEATNKTIELIDVLWLKGNSILAAFEVESTTSVYSGLLRMSDLLSLQPNLEIKLYLVAPDDRRNKVQQEILRPTFSMREKPLPQTCGFIPFAPFIDRMEKISSMGLAASLKPEFLDTIAEYF